MFAHCMMQRKVDLRCYVFFFLISPFISQSPRSTELLIAQQFDLSHSLCFIYLIIIITVQQGWTLALARSPMQGSKVSDECKSPITRPFCEYDFSLPRN